MHKNYKMISIGVIILLLLIILGIVAFHAYAFVTTKNGLNIGAGGSLSIFGSDMGMGMNDNYNDNIDKPYY